MPMAWHIKRLNALIEGNATERVVGVRAILDSKARHVNGKSKSVPFLSFTDVEDREAYRLVHFGAENSL